MLYHHLQMRWWGTNSSLNALVTSLGSCLYVNSLDKQDKGFLCLSFLPPCCAVTGYFAVDSDSTPERLVFNRTVTLKDSYGKAGPK